MPGKQPLDTSTAERELEKASINYEVESNRLMVDQNMKHSEQWRGISLTISEIKQIRLCLADRIRILEAFLRENDSAHPLVTKELEKLKDLLGRI
jgi:hypothetical protein